MAMLIIQAVLLMKRLNYLASNDEKYVIERPQGNVYRWAWSSLVEGDEGL